MTAGADAPTVSGLIVGLQLAGAGAIGGLIVWLVAEWRRGNR